MDDGWVEKNRPIYQPHALRLLREATVIQKARALLPSAIDGVQIILPQSKLKIRLGYISVLSRYFAGQDLHTLLTQPAQHELCVTMGLRVLQALQTISPTGDYFPLYSRFYNRMRFFEIILREKLPRGSLTTEQKQHFVRLLRQYVTQPSPQTVLVHGDLQVSHIIVAPAQDAVGVIDFEAARLGKPATNFAQLWDGYYYTTPQLGDCFYQRYASQFPEIITSQFDEDVKAELALRCYSHIHSNLPMLVLKAQKLLRRILSNEPFAAICMDSQ